MDNAAMINLSRSGGALPGLTKVNNILAIGLTVIISINYKIMNLTHD
jgi:hypothetical protein